MPYVSANGTIGQGTAKPLLRQIQDAFMRVWELLVMFFMTLVDPTTKTDRIGKGSNGRAQNLGGGGSGGGGGGGGPGKPRFRNMSSSSGPTVDVCQTCG